MTETIEIPMGRTVLCDFCGHDWTDSDAGGGFLFQSKATGPCCADRLEASARKYNEMRFIRAEPVDGESFADFTRRIRGDNNTVRVIGCDSVEDMLEQIDKLGEPNG